ncbi:hypothetical protein F8388_014971 [Cannabis sativa]|uniref:Uncharacterized protein n=1 Tax=Cannabis sativa TaxID=3483 RepID=A0A7J6DXZ8_CANSA|nr:hypothetical protein F8388_014971 [Cannabis sativa]
MMKNNILQVSSIQKKVKNLGATGSRSRVRVVDQSNSIEKADAVEQHQINGERVGDEPPVGADPRNGFQKLDKIKDSSRQSKQLEELTTKMRECKSLTAKSKMRSPEILLTLISKLNDEKQSMIKELNSYVALRKTYLNSLGNKKLNSLIWEQELVVNLQRRTMFKWHQLCQIKN